MCLCLRAVPDRASRCRAHREYLTAKGQRIWVGRGGFFREAPKWAKRGNFDGGFNYCRGFYTSDRREDGGMGWWTDYPGADNNFSVRLAELTFVRVKLDASGQPDNVVVQLTDQLLSHCPLLFMEDVGTIRFSDEEVEHLRNYLLKGGFLYVDDFWGTQAWEQWIYELGRVLPANKYPIFDIPRDHQIMHALYEVKERARLLIQATHGNQLDVGARLDERQPAFRLSRHPG
jgi:hypothetical protein